MLSRDIRYFRHEIFQIRAMNNSKKETKKETDSKNLGRLLQDQNKVLKKLIKEIEKDKN
jgi:hypothetical protein